MENQQNTKQLASILPTSMDQYSKLLASFKSLGNSERITLLRALCRTDLYFLLRYALNRPDVEKEWIFDRCREIQANPNGYIDIWSREHYKSTIITFGKTIQDILSSHGDNPLPEWNGREVTVGIFSFNRPAAKKFLRQIKIEFEDNDELKKLFPDVLYAEPKKEAPKWSEDDGLVVKRKSNPREATLEASGLVDGQPTGMHYLLRVYDDVVTLESARSIEMIKKTTQAWGLSLSLGSDGGYSRYVGTFYADGDTYNDIIERDAAIPRIHPATDNGKSDGKTVLFSQAYLEEKKKAGIHDFSCQYLCDPIPDGNAYFNKDNFQWYDKIPKHLNIFGASDYAVTEGGGDWTELGIAGVDANDDLYLLDWWSGQTKADVWIEEQLDLVRKWKPVKWASEAGPIRRSVESFLIKRMTERRDYVSLTWIPTIHSKVLTLRSFQARVERGKVYFPVSKPWAEDLVRQLMRFPVGRVDDKVDVCGLFGRIIDKMWSASAPEETTLTLVDDSYGLEEDNGSDDWKTG